MSESETPSQSDAPAPSRPRRYGFLRAEWPYLLVLALALFGIAYTSFARTPMTYYWVVLAPVIGVICVVTRWPSTASRDERLRLIWTQALHWAAVLLAMHLMFGANVARMLNADGSALAALTLLALGTFTAGVHTFAWRICLLGVVLGVGVPGIAWLERSALLILLIALLVVALIAPFVWRERQASKTNGQAAPIPTQP
jgi:hypothetical protein